MEHSKKKSLLHSTVKKVESIRKVPGQVSGVYSVLDWSIGDYSETPSRTTRAAMMREAVKRACKVLLALWCLGTGSDAAPSMKRSTSSIAEDEPSTAILVAIGNNSNHEHLVLGKWANLGRGSTANHLAVWVLCVKGSSTESSVRELPYLLPFVVEESYSWARIIRDFSVQVRIQNASNSPSQHQ